MTTFWEHLEYAASNTEAVRENRWSEAKQDCVLELVFGWVTTGRLPESAVGFIADDLGLVAVTTDCQIIATLCPMLYTLS